MEKEFLNSQLLVCSYERKEGTATSYYRTSGSNILPIRIGISKDCELVPAQRKGRNLQLRAGQLKGAFTQLEESPLKQHKPYKISTGIYKIPEYPLFIGYGTIGISNPEGKITRESDTEDLVVFHTLDNWKNITIYYLPKCGSPNEMESAFSFLNELVKQSQQAQSE